MLYITLKHIENDQTVDRHLIHRSETVFNDTTWDYKEA